MRKKSDLKIYAFILCAVLLSKLLGLVRDTMLANYYGTSLLSSAFSVASKIPLLFFDITLGTAVSAAFIPVFNEALQQGDRSRAFRFANIFASCAALVGILFSVLLFAFPGVAVTLMASGFDAQTAAQSAGMLRVMSPVVLIAVLSYSYVGVLQSLGEFNRPAIMSALSNLCVIGYYLFLNSSFGIAGLCVAVIVGWLLQLAILIGPMRKFGYHWRFLPRFSDPGIRMVGLLALPVLLSSWVQPINSVVASQVASHLDGGESVIVVNYAYQLYYMVAGVFALSLTNLFFPRMSRICAAGDQEKAGKLLHRLLGFITFLVLPVSAYFALFSNQLVQTVYQRGEFTAADTMLVGGVLCWYGVGMLGLSWQEILNKFFYSGKDTKTPMFVALGGIALNLLLAVVLSRRMGAAGVGVALSISTTIMGGALFLLSGKKAVRLEPIPVLAQVGKGLCCLALSLIAMVLCAKSIPFEGGLVRQLLWHAAVFGSGLLAYVPLCFWWDALRVRGVFSMLTGKEETP